MSAVRPGPPTCREQWPSDGMPPKSEDMDKSRNCRTMPRASGDGRKQPGVETAKGNGMSASQRAAVTVGHAGASGPERRRLIVENKNSVPTADVVRDGTAGSGKGIIGAGFATGTEALPGDCACATARV